MHAHNKVASKFNNTTNEYCYNVVINRLYHHYCTSLVTQLWLFVCKPHESGSLYTSKFNCKSGYICVFSFKFGLNCFFFKSMFLSFLRHTHIQCHKITTFTIFHALLRIDVLHCCCFNISFCKQFCLIT